MADVIFCYPKTDLEVGSAVVELPLSLVSIAAPLMENYSVKFVDCRIDENWERDLENHLKQNPLMFLTPAMTGPQITHALEVSKLAKKYNVPTVWGGYHPSLFPVQTAKHPLIDFVVMGDGEDTVFELAGGLAKKEQDFSRIKGIAYKENGHVRVNQKREAPNFETMPELPYKHFKAGRYVKGKLMASYDPSLKRILPFISSRGCPHGCKFCSQPKFSERRWNSMSAEKTIAQTDQLVQDFDLDAVTFYDENFLTNIKRSEKIAELIGGRYKWGIQARMDELGKSDIHRLEAGGLNFVQPGIESGSNRILDMVDKGAHVETFLDVNKKLSTTKDLCVVYNFMVGFPTETREEMMQTIDLASRLLRDNPKSYVAGFYIFTPYPGTAMFDVAVEHGFKPPEDLESWADYSRHQNLTPWVKSDSAFFRNIFVASKFIDGKRIGHYVDNSIMKKTIQMYSKFTRPLWGMHWFKLRPDLAVMSKLMEKKGVI